MTAEIGRKYLQVPHPIRDLDREHKSQDLAIECTRNSIRDKTQEAEAGGFEVGEQQRDHVSEEEEEEEEEEEDGDDDDDDDPISMFSNTYPFNT